MLKYLLGIALAFAIGADAYAQQQSGKDIGAELQKEQILRGAEVIIFGEICSNLATQRNAARPEFNSIARFCESDRPPIFALHCNDAQTACSCISRVSCATAFKICDNFSCTNKDDAGNCIGGAGSSCTGE